MCTIQDFVAGDPVNLKTPRYKSLSGLHPFLGIRTCAVGRCFNSQQIHFISRSLFIPSMPADAVEDVLDTKILRSGCEILFPVQDNPVSWKYIL